MASPILTAAKFAVGAAAVFILLIENWSCTEPFLSRRSWLPQGAAGVMFGYSALEYFARGELLLGVLTGGVTAMLFWTAFSRFRRERQLHQTSGQTFERARLRSSSATRTLKKLVRRLIL